MKRRILLFAATIAASASVGLGADAAATWNSTCASCHGKDGAGQTMMGKKLGVKDYSTAAGQSFSDSEAEKAIMDGKGKMKGFKGKLSDADVKALVAYIRTLKK